MAAGELSPAAAAFDAVAVDFDRRFRPWHSVAKQRRAVRSALRAAFPPAARVLEIGGGTGDDALWLAHRGRFVLATDASPAMVAICAAKLGTSAGSEARVVAAEEMERFAQERLAAGEPPFDGAFSNFAGLNCVADLAPVARGLANLVSEGAPVLLVLFGTFCPGEMLVEAVRRRPANMFRRRKRGDVPARIGERNFTVRYHRHAEIRRAMAPWFALKNRRGIGLFVPPSAAEPWISRHPRLLRVLEVLDRALARPFAPFADHIIYRFERTSVISSQVDSPDDSECAGGAGGAGSRQSTPTKEKRAQSRFNRTGIEPGVGAG